MNNAVISFQGVSKRFGHRSALDDIDFDLRPGSTLGIVGESGSGKTTCVRLAIGLERPTSGNIMFQGRPYPRSARQLRRIRRRIGLVFQDPYDSLDPRMKIGDIVAEPLRILGNHGPALREKVRSVLASVGLPDAPVDGYPAQYSGGGRQRIAIARALILEPEVLLCDEPTASLDVSVQAQIINLLLQLRRERDLSMIFVSHDLDLVKRVADSMVVLYAGRIMETGAVETIIHRPAHPYTRTLLASIPGEHPRNRRLVGKEVEASISAAVDEVAGGMSRGCVFADRCYKAQEQCRASRPPLVLGEELTRHACFFPEHLTEEPASSASVTP